MNETPAVIVTPETCPRCHSRLIEQTACCKRQRQGWKTMYRCPKAGCGFRKPGKRI
jgi:predicted RNA-binding Zn-ribbon protein involved in translation (DUF1610 family)